MNENNSVPSAGKPGAPIFIIGCPRSGTTLLRLILDSHPNISCGPESKFLFDMAKIVDSHWPSISLFGFDEEYWHRRIADFYENFQTEYMISRGKVRWAEKTPSYTKIVEFLDAAFPTAQFVHIVRNPYDVVASYLFRWGRDGGNRAIAEWPAYVEGARQFGAKLPTHRYYELRYEGLVTHPEETIRDLLGFLNEEWTPSLLDYRNSQHDTGELPITAARRAESNGDSAIYIHRLGKGRKELPMLMRLRLQRRCGSLLKELGY